MSQINNLTCAVVSVISGMTFADTILVPTDYDTIQEAIDVSVEGDTVIVSAGTYYETISFSGKAITVQSESGDPADTIIDASVSWGSVANFDNDETSSSILDGFTLRNGSSTNGGGVYIQTASPTLKNLIISGNTASSSGGGIFIDSGTLTLESVAVKGNTSSVAGGGAYIRYSSGSMLTSSFENNSSNSGGGIYFKDAPDGFVLTEVDFEDNNSATTGGGLFNKNTEITAQNCSFISNSAVDGGGWFSYSYGNATVGNTTFINNTVTGSGGAANIRSNSSVSFTECTFDSNIADSDCDNSGTSGAIEISSNSSVTLQDPTICVNLICDVLEDFSDGQPTIVGDIQGCSSGLGACCGGDACWEMDYNDCLDGGGVFSGEDVVCAMVECFGANAGGCCIDDQCVMSATESACLDADGEFAGVLIECEDVLCLGCPADINGDGSVEVNDIIELISTWGVCP